MKELFKKIVVAILEWEASFVLKKYKPKIVAVTGSVGKTSTKDAIFTVMSTGFFVRKSEKSFNSEIGTPAIIIHSRNAILGSEREPAFGTPVPIPSSKTAIFTISISLATMMPS